MVDGILLLDDDVFDAKMFRHASPESGVEALDSLRQLGADADLPVFAVTTTGLPSDRDEAHGVGIEGPVRTSGDERDVIVPIVDSDRAASRRNAPAC